MKRNLKTACFWLLAWPALTAWAQNTPNLSELEIVGTQEAVFTQEQRSDTEADAVSIPIGEAMDALSLTDEQMINDLKTLLWARPIGRDNDGNRIMSTTLLSNKSASSGKVSFWFAQTAWYRNNGDGTFTTRLGSESYTTTNSRMKLANITYDATTRSLQGELSQAAGKLLVGDYDYAELYLVNGTKAQRIALRLLVTEEKAQGTYPLDAMTRVGQTSVSVEQEKRNDYTAVTFNLDIADIASQLGCKVSQIRQKAMEADGTLIPPNEEKGGWWFDREGHTQILGGGLFYIEPTTSAMTKWNVGQNPGSLRGGDVLGGTIYLCYEDKYYQLDVTLNVTGASSVLDTMEKVGEESVSVSQEPRGDWEGVHFTIDIEHVATLLGCSVSQIQHRAMTRGGELQAGTDGNTGWWFDPEGYYHTFTGGTFYVEPVGTGLREWRAGQMPNTLKSGDHFTTTIYLVYQQKYYELHIDYTIK